MMSMEQEANPKGEQTKRLKKSLLLGLGVLGLAYALYLFLYTPEMLSNDDVLYWWEIPYAIGELIFSLLLGWGAGRWVVALIVALPSILLLKYAISLR